MIKMIKLSFFIGCFITLINGSSKDTRIMIVTATAYNSLPSQTTAIDPDIAAWGDRLKPGMKAIAVSRDLLKEGLTHNVKVKIKGLEGTYVVLDKMNKRWKRRIDLYMGVDVKAARQWGKKKVKIIWKVKLESKDWNILNHNYFN